jgi:hypothetical protein
MAICVPNRYVQPFPTPCQVFKGRLILGHSRQNFEHIRVDPGYQLCDSVAIRTYELDIVLGSKDNLAINSLSARAAETVIG